MASEPEQIATADGDVVLRDVGTVEFEPGLDHEVVSVAHGVHEFYDDPAGFDRLVCEVLLG